MSRFIICILFFMFVVFFSVYQIELFNSLRKKERRGSFRYFVNVSNALITVIEIFNSAQILKAF